MNNELAHIGRYRLHNQQIVNTSIQSIGKMAAWMGATQAQDYTHGKWAFGLRLPHTTDVDVEAAIDRGDIIRTHVLRPTWHFVAAEDLRWMLALSAPQINTAIATFNVTLGLDEHTFERSKAVMAKSLEGGLQLTREEIMADLGRAGIATDSLRGNHLMMRAEIDGLVCNGSRRGKQITYALIDDRVPKSKMLDRPAALEELARRYFRSHAPATLHDYQWWSGLKMPDARAGLEAIQSELVSETIGKQTFWMPNDFKASDADTSGPYLLPAFDEYLVSYRDRAASLDTSKKAQAITGNGIFKPVVLHNAWVQGVWQRTFLKKRLSMAYTWFENGPSLDLMEPAHRRLAVFYGLEA